MTYRRLKEVTTKIGSGATPRGGKEAYKESGVSLIRSQNVLDFNFSLDGLVFLDDEQATKLKNVQIYKNDILLNITGDSVARACIVPIDVLPARVNQHVMIVRTDSHKVNYQYLFYYIQYLKRQLLQLASGGATRNALTKSMIENLEIYVPNLEIQDKIVNILSSFDDKIKNNNAIIAKLEEQAQILYKSEFLNEESLGESKFHRTKLGKLFSFVKGKKPKKNLETAEEGCLPYIVKKYIDNNELTFVGANDGVLINDLDVFMLMDGANSGNIYYGYHGILGSTFSLLKNDNELVNEYIYWYLKIKEEEVRKQNTGSAIPHTSKDYINNMEVLFPVNINEHLLLLTLRNIRLFSVNLRRESYKLAKIRDSLLPKLMTGKLKVGDVEI